jgi:hypothetical protein
LFIHRDSEGQDLANRIGEIEAAVGAVDIDPGIMVVGIVPIRMQEAWLLFDERAIRRAAGNPNGRQVLRLPPIKRIEALPDPKKVLYDLLREASGLKGRRLSRFSASKCAPQVSSFTEDFGALRSLSGFAYFEANLREQVQARE